jgi:DNA-directed RNA polymerase subunit omega
LLYPSIDKLLTIVDSKYILVHVAARRSREMYDNNYYQLKEKDYNSTKNLGRALEEIALNLIQIK